MNSKRKSENTSRQMTMKTQPYKMYGMQKNSSKREVHSNIGLPPETNKQTNKKNKWKLRQKNLTYHLKELRKEELTEPKVSRRKEIIIISEEINKIYINIKNNKNDQ